MTVIYVKITFHGDQFSVCNFWRGVTFRGFVWFHFVGVAVGNVHAIVLELIRV